MSYIQRLYSCVIDALEGKMRSGVKGEEEELEGKKVKVMKVESDWRKVHPDGD